MWGFIWVRVAVFTLGMGSRERGRSRASLDLPLAPVLSQILEQEGWNRNLEELGNGPAFKSPLKIILVFHALGFIGVRVAVFTLGMGSRGKCGSRASDPSLESILNSWLQFYPSEAAPDWSRRVGTGICWGWEIEELPLNPGFKPGMLLGSGWSCSYMSREWDPGKKEDPEPLIPPWNPS